MHYKFIATKRNGDDQESHCRSLGGNLATVPNARTNDFLVELIRNSGIEVNNDDDNDDDDDDDEYDEEADTSIEVHIGGYWNGRSVSNGKHWWQWWDKTDFYQSTNYHNWGPGEPDGELVYNNFLSIAMVINASWTEDGKWSDVSRSDEKFGICQKSLGGWRLFRGKFYKITEIEATAVEHKEKCAELGGQLASAPDEETMDVFTEMMKRAG